MRKINKIIIHCTAGNINNTARDIVYFHTGPKSKGCKGWKAPGYHFFIDKNGNVTQIWPLEKISNGVIGHNADSINIVYAGGVDQKDFKTPMDTRTPAQKATLVKLLKELRPQFPDAKIYGHRDFAAKPCPCFDAKEEYKDI